MSSAHTFFFSLKSFKNRFSDLCRTPALRCLKFYIHVMMKTWAGLILLLCGVILRTEGACHCREGCDRGEEANCTACQEGWFGSYCQKRNVALHGRAEQIDTYRESGSRTRNVNTFFTADLAVDGNNNTDFYTLPFTCSHTDRSLNAWWKVHLGTNGVNQIRYMTIYNRNTFEWDYRHRGMEVLVNGQTCYKWTKQEIPPTVSHVTCGETLIGDEVTIRIDYKYLMLCEVQVFVCSDFWFGEDCDLKCQCLNSSEICDKGSGHCESGCPVGLTGGGCLQECVNGTYGLNCSSVCGHCLNNGACNKTSGQCPRGCEVGWASDTCDKEVSGVVDISTDAPKRTSFSTGWIAAVCFGVVIVLLTVVVALFVFRWRRERLQSNTERYAAMTTDTTGKAVYFKTVQQVNGQRVAQAKIAQRDDFMYL